MAIQQAFNIVSAFKFEVGAALASSSKMGKQLRGLSEQAKELNEQLKFSAVSWGTQLTGTQFGVLGFFKNILETSRDTYDIQRKMATMMVTNQSRFADGPKNMADAMQRAFHIMKDMNAEANKWGLDSFKYHYTTESLNAALIKKGVTGVNFGATRELARNVLLGSDMLPGMGRVDVQGSIESIVSGFASRQHELWKKLTGDTDTMKKYGKNVNAFNILPAAKRVELLNRAFKELIDKSDVLKYRVNTLEFQMTVLNNLFRGTGNVFSKMGNVLRRFVIDNLKLVNEFVSKQLAPVFDKLGNVLHNLVSGKSLVDLYFQIKNLSTIGKSLDFSKMSASLIFFTAEIVTFALAFNKFSAWMGMSARVAVSATDTFRSVFKKVLPYLIMIGKFLARSALYFAKFYAISLLFSRVWETAKIKGQQKNVELLGKSISASNDVLLELGKTLHSLYAPFHWLIDVLGSIIAPLTSWAGRLNLLMKALNLFPGIEIKDTTQILGALAKGISKFGSALQALFATIATLVVNIPRFVIPNFGGKWVSNKLMDSIIGKDPMRDKNASFTDKFFNTFSAIMNQMREKQKDLDEDSVRKAVVNVNKIEIKNQFAENFDADRVGVTIMDQIVERATNTVSTIRNNPAKIPGLVRS